LFICSFKAYNLKGNLKKKRKMGDNILIEETEFGKLTNGEQVKLFKLKNQNDFQLNLITYGASIQSILVKDKEKKLVNVALGFDTLEGIFVQHLYSIIITQLVLIFLFQNTQIDH